MSFDKRRNVDYSPYSLGIGRIEDSFNEFIAVGQEMAERAAKNLPGDRFAYDSSGISRRASEPTTEASVLVVDVGGTHTKVGVCHFDPAGDAVWTMLFDRNNEEFRPLGGLSKEKVPLSAFSLELARQIINATDGYKISPSDIKGLSVIWSNALIAKSLDDSERGVRGVTALVTQYGEGQAYRKGEWFNQGLHNGLDLGQTFLDEFANLGIQPEVFDIGNDTVFSLKALPGAHGGVVASSGANATLIDAADIIRNSEMGAWFKIPPRFLSDADSKAGNNLRLEDLVAGKGIGKILTAHLHLLKERGLGSVDPILRSLSRRQGNLSSKDMSTVLKGDCLQCEVEGFFSPEAHQVLREYASAITRRAGFCVAAMIGLSLHGQKAGTDGFVVALDSAMARHIPGYMEAVQEGVRRVEQIVSAKIQVKLLCPEGFVTVPMRGAANSVGDYL